MACATWSKLYCVFNQDVWGGGEEGLQTLAALGFSAAVKMAVMAVLQAVVSGGMSVYAEVFI